MLAAKCHLGTKPYGVHIRVIGVRGAEQIASVSTEVGAEISGKSEPTIHVVSQSRAESLALILKRRRERCAGGYPGTGKTGDSVQSGIGIRPGIAAEQLPLRGRLLFLRHQQCSYQTNLTEE